MNYLMGIDCGTTGTKAAIVDDSGKMIAQAYREYACTYPRPGWVEQGLDTLLESTFTVAAEALRKSGLAPDTICSIAFSAQRCCTIAVDRDGKLLRPMISWQDNRSVEEVELIRKEVSDDDFYDIVRLPQSTTWMLSKILWLQRNEPETWSRVHKVVQLHDYLLYSWGAGELYVDHCEAAFYGCWDTARLKWSDRLLKVGHITAEQLSTPRANGERVGGVSESAARATGLKAGTPLCVGAGDQNAGALGAGVVGPHLLSVSLGTGGAVCACVDHAFHDASRRTMVTNHVAQGLWLVEGYQAGAASVFRWFRDQFAAIESAYAKVSDRDTYDILTELIGKAPVGSKGLLLMPYFASAGTPRWNSAARGTLLGMTFAHDRYCVARAFIEGITLEVRDMLESLVKAGITYERVHLLGGPTKSPLWNQIQADVYGHPVCTLSNGDAAVTGAAILGGVGVGVFKDAASGVEHLVNIKKLYEPDQFNHERYSELYTVYQNLYAALDNAGIYEQISGLQQKFGETRK